MASPLFTSGKDLLCARGRGQSVPPSGEKLQEVGGSCLEAKQLETRLREHQELLQEPKVARRDQVSKGKWLLESRMVNLVCHTGKFWHYMGAETDIGRCLYPEEALYLIDTGELEVEYNGIVLSMQQAEELLLEDSHHLERYLVYAHLSRTGCKLLYHQPHLVFTKYEKEIRLDQHQSNTGRKKLKLDKKKIVNPTDSCTSQIKVEDNSLKEFYESLGDAAKNPLLEEREDSDIHCDKKNISGDPPNFQQKKKEQLSDYELQWKKLLDMIPNMYGQNVINVDVESPDLLPKGCKPIKQSYQISQLGLWYYSIYEEGRPESDAPRKQRGPECDWGQRWGQGNNRFQSRTRGSSWPDPPDSWRDDRFGNSVSGDRWKDTSSGGHDRWGNCDGDIGGRRWGHDGNRWEDGGGSNDRWKNDGGDWGNHWKSRGENHREADHGDWRSQHFQGRDRKRKNDYWQHDWREPDYEQSTNHGGEYHNQQQNRRDRTDIVDYDVRPAWKRKRCVKRRQQGRDCYPSSLLWVGNEIRSWKEYKNHAKEVTCTKMLKEKMRNTLWKGTTTPLLKPIIASSAEAVLETCSLGSQVKDWAEYKAKVPQESRLQVHYDVYLPTVPYKKTKPSLPSKRVVVMRDGMMPSPGQLLELTTRFHDDVPVVGGLVAGGEVRLYTLSTLSLPPPCTL
ncbi:hypothetical protein Pcinc_025979 [Petrolisthes cinctipes]|uniref:tRNA-splicing endonuclease subunit Sen54 N-terminal domain-containing protein n=1 Tax=Petrolisthes cinctipes TaxID=88211 RepID=A0AAE1F868_PETCI|nr:hypothetical protein Pcinc_025979 [Petrolisthes cinctipes]